ncbi:hypothetical protein [Mycoplasma todarodis]|uniref:Uncharacterized protein n=1 Tax=Mycoplasma todarodis TaxID=1937191 RepID=A0A4R0XSS7_9MOLU|nr:hypothetical protein [Mycoplasma todarodis]TCG11942.1 hypothetical protein C4B25_00360 [Mycoplasma todarodis]
MDKGASFHSEEEISFSNFISGDKEEAKKYAKLIFEHIELLGSKTLGELEDYISSNRNADFIDSDSNVEKVYWTLRKYGLADRYIIKDMFQGENFRRIEFINSFDEGDVIEPYIINDNKVKILKTPIRNGKENFMRIVCLYNIEEEKLYPLFLDTQHTLFSSSTPDDSKISNISNIVYMFLLKQITDKDIL